MKVTKPFTLDLELVIKLKDVDNMSKLVNDLLTEHFKENESEQTI